MPASSRRSAGSAGRAPRARRRLAVLEHVGQRDHGAEDLVGRLDLDQQRVAARAALAAARTISSTSVRAASIPSRT